MQYIISTGTTLSLTLISLSPAPGIVFVPVLTVMLFPSHLVYNFSTLFVFVCLFVCLLIKAKSPDDFDLQLLLF